MKRKLMKRKYVTLSDLCLKKLDAMGKHTGLSASELIRNSVDVYWEKLVKEKLEQVKNPGIRKRGRR